jgi:hypothetical protein
MLRIWKALILEAKLDNLDYAEGLERKKVIQIVDNCFLFAVIWSLCITINSDSPVAGSTNKNETARKAFDQRLKAICDGSLEKIELKFANKKLIPSKFDRGTIYDYVYHADTDEWEHWMEKINKDELD